MNMKRKPRLSSLPSILSTKQAKTAGVSRTTLAYQEDKGGVERLYRGHYIQPAQLEKQEVPFGLETLVGVAVSIAGVVCLISALSLYGLTEEVPRESWIAIPHKKRSPEIPNVRIIRMRNIKTGRTSILIGKIRVSIFDPARTIVDAFRFLDREVALKGLKKFIKKYPHDIELLLSYSKKLRTPIRSYIEAMTNE